MNTTFRTLATVATLSVAGFASASAFAADSQLIAAAGLTPAEAQDLSLDQLFQLKINRDNGRDERQATVTPGLSSDRADGLSPSGAVARLNTNSSRDERQVAVPGAGRVTLAARSDGTVDPSAHAQLIAAAGLSADEAGGLTLSQIAALKFDREDD